MGRSVCTGFHAIEEKLKRLGQDSSPGLSYTVYYTARPGPRARRILDLAHTYGVPCVETQYRDLDALASALEGPARDHRGILLAAEGGAGGGTGPVDFDTVIDGLGPEEPALVLLLDSITDPHNIGAILRSACQFGATLVALPKRNTLREIHQNEAAARASAGALSWVPVAVVPNLARAARKLKKAGFWLYGADPQGEPLPEVRFEPRTALVLGSEGSGISRLLAKECDIPVGIPMGGSLDSLNVSVAAGVLLYEAYTQRILGR
ncbi:MAG: 23S rRNA (guanosine(2251)-2'-O)-methyltransferase RlmB [Spirochaetaceae bacterium]|jgi:23S rRNA (guanosine2251-2'-O)-methyltransferase|nr:23S rRNA (guanosine(2251)-2'-O)-methyltransferase RlmB [Spirochaetaceae bacterium]